MALRIPTLGSQGVCGDEHMVESAVDHNLTANVHLMQKGIKNRTWQNLRVQLEMELTCDQCNACHA